MSNTASLATHYRPQTFAEVVGQELVTSILSRAVRENRLAHGYVFSGTRGVGKTTIARIFAKAINCRNPKNGEPCNECDICRSITQGNFVDVVEMDGASNRKIEDIRHLREVVGYTPMEGKYKVFILDEAHMLTKEAFNAFLKTLEEPPSHAIFIMATTELDEFPITIRSRCQQFVFRQVPEDLIEGHLRDILTRENRTYEEEAVHLIALRASGSVRDSMSLLGQVLSFDSGEKGNHLTADQVRQVLGLASRDILNKILSAIFQKNSLILVNLVKEIFDQGVDITFFLRELTNLWRNLFLVKQAGVSILDSMPLSYAEKENIKKMSEHFSLTFLHAAWQMTLDAQQSLKKSVDPANGLELLLLNLSMMPLLIPLEEIQFIPDPKIPLTSVSESQEKTESISKTVRPAQREQLEKDEQENSAISQNPASTEPKQSTIGNLPKKINDLNNSPSDTISKARIEKEEIIFTQPTQNIPEKLPQLDKATDEKNWQDLPIDTILSWESFLTFAEKQGGLSMPTLRQLNGEVHGNVLSLQGRYIVNTQFLQKPEQRNILEAMVKNWAGRKLTLVFLKPKTEFRTEAEIKAELLNKPIIKKFQEEFNATIEHCQQKQ